MADPNKGEVIKIFFEELIERRQRNSVDRIALFPYERMFPGRMTANQGLEFVSYLMGVPSTMSRSEDRLQRLGRDPGLVHRFRRPLQHAARAVSGP